MFKVNASDIQELFEHLARTDVDATDPDLTDDAEKNRTQLFQKLQAVAHEYATQQIDKFTDPGESRSSPHVPAECPELQALRTQLASELQDALGGTSSDGSSIPTGRSWGDAEVMQFDQLSLGSDSGGSDGLSDMLDAPQRLEAAVHDLAAQDTRLAALQLLTSPSCRTDELCCAPCWPALSKNLAECLASTEPSVAQMARELLGRLLKELLAEGGAAVQLAQLLAPSLPSLTAQPVRLCLTGPCTLKDILQAAQGQAPAVLPLLLRSLHLLSKDWHYLPPGFQPKLAAAIASLTTHPSAFCSGLLLPAAQHTLRPGAAAVQVPAGSAALKGSSSSSAGGAGAGTAGGVEAEAGWDQRGREGGDVAGGEGCVAMEASGGGAVEIEVGCMEVLWMLEPGMRWWRRAWATAALGRALAPHMQGAQCPQRLHATAAAFLGGGPDSVPSAATAGALLAHTRARQAAAEVQLVASATITSAMVSSAAGRSALEGSAELAGEAGQREGCQEVVEKLCGLLGGWGEAGGSCAAAAGMRAVSEALQDAANACPRLFTLPACALLARPLLAQQGLPPGQGSATGTDSAATSTCGAEQQQWCGEVLLSLALSSEGAQALLRLQVEAPPGSGPSPPPTTRPPAPSTRLSFLDAIGAAVHPSSPSSPPHSRNPTSKQPLPPHPTLMVATSYLEAACLVAPYCTTPRTQLRSLVDALCDAIARSASSPSPPPHASASDSISQDAIKGPDPTAPLLEALLKLSASSPQVPDIIAQHQAARERCAAYLVAQLVAGQAPGSSSQEYYTMHMQESELEQGLGLGSRGRATAGSGQERPPHGCSALQPPQQLGGGCDEDRRLQLMCAAAALALSLRCRRALVQHGFARCLWRQVCRLMQRSDAASLLPSAGTAQRTSSPEPGQQLLDSFGDMLAWTGMVEALLLERPLDGSTTLKEILHCLDLTRLPPIPVASRLDAALLAAAALQPLATARPAALLTLCNANLHPLPLTFLLQALLPPQLPPQLQERAATPEPPDLFTPPNNSSSAPPTAVPHNSAMNPLPANPDAIPSRTDCQGVLDILHSLQSLEGDGSSSLPGSRCTTGDSDRLPPGSRRTTGDSDCLPGSRRKTDDSDRLPPGSRRTTGDSNHSVASGATEEQATGGRRRTTGDSDTESSLAQEGADRGGAAWWLGGARGEGGAPAWRLLRRTTSSSTTSGEGTGGWQGAGEGGGWGPLDEAVRADPGMKDATGWVRNVQQALHTHLEAGHPIPPSSAALLLQRTVMVALGASALATAPGDCPLAPWCKAVKPPWAPLRLHPPAPDASGRPPPVHILQASRLLLTLQSPPCTTTPSYPGSSHTTTTTPRDPPTPPHLANPTPLAAALHHLSHAIAHHSPTPTHTSTTSRQRPNTGAHQRPTPTPTDPFAALVWQLVSPTGGQAAFTAVLSCLTLSRLAAYIWPAWGVHVLGGRPLAALCQCVDGVVRREDPKGWARLRALGVPLQQVVGRWLEGVFWGLLPFEDVVVVMCLACVHGPEVLVAVAACMVCRAWDEGAVGVSGGGVGGCRAVGAGFNVRAELVEIVGCLQRCRGWVEEVLCGCFE